MKILFVFVLTMTFLGFHAQEMEVDYTVSKIDGKDTLRQAYTLRITGDQSVFLSPKKCAPEKQDPVEQMILQQMSPASMIELRPDHYTLYDEVEGIKVQTALEGLPLKWNIDPQKRTENTFHLRKATALYHQKLWTAWFIEDIPVPDGPFIFAGLPGLIYSVQDDDYKFQLQKISKNLKPCRLSFLFIPKIYHNPNISCF